VSDFAILVLYIATIKVTSNRYRVKTTPLFTLSPSTHSHRSLAQWLIESLWLLAHCTAY